jgi:hypothetical protein
MDERDQNPLTISDILEQLVKPSVVQGGTQPPQPKPIVPPTMPLPKPTGGSISLPQLNKQVAQEPATKSPNEITGRPSDRRPTIRTMKDDLVRLKQGLAPLGLELLAKKSTPIQAKQAPPSAPVKTANIPPDAPAKPPLPPISSKPVTPPERLTPPKIQPPFLGPKLVVPPVTLPPLSTNTPAHFHEEIRILDKDNLPAFLGAPVPKKTAPKPEEEKVEYGVIAKIIGSGMTTGIVSTMILAVATYGLIYYFFLREEAIITTIPTLTPAITSPRVETNELEEIFRTIPITTFSMPVDSNLLIPEFRSFLEKETLVQKEFERIRFLPIQPSETLTFIELFDKLAIKYPAELKNWVKNNNIVFLYGQMENFNSLGNSNKRIVFIVEVKDATKVTEVMKNWEATMSDDLKNFFDVDPSKGASAPFLDNERLTVKIRYKNFPLPDRTIDYAIVSSLTGRYYLILTNSRESIYSPIDKIKGL